MKKLLAIVILVALSSFQLKAGMPHISFGAEWGYTGTFLKTSQHNFICSEGYRIIENPVSGRYFSNGSVLVNAGVDVSGKINLSVYSGLQGVYSHRWVVPVMMRMRWCPAGLDSDGFLLFAGGGATFPTTVLRETGAESQLGVGYRVALFKGISVDLLLSWNVTLDSETIIDPDTRMPVPRNKMTTNTTEYQGINISLALNF